MERRKLGYATVVDRRADLVRYAHKITGDRDRAEDVVQEAYLRFGEAAAKQQLDQPGRYLARIVRNLALDRVWRARREAATFASDGEAAMARAVADKPSPEAQALSRDEHRRLCAALDELPERTRLAVEMHRFAGARLREIAEELGISVTLAHQLVTEGVAHCRRRLR